MPTTSLKSSAQLMMVPTPGIPLSVKQVEEHRRKLSDGTFAVEYTVTARQYRDSKGRVRIESETEDQTGNSSGLSVSITDPVAGVQTLLVRAEKIAYRQPMKLSGEAQLLMFDAADGQDSPHTWKVTDAGAEDRMIEGYEFKGSHVETSAEDVAGLTTSIDQWYSDKLKLIGAVDRKGPFKAYIIRVVQLQLGEPDSKLFEIPSDHKVVDLRTPQP